MSVKLFRRPLESWLGILVLGLIASVGLIAANGANVSAATFSELNTKDKVKAFYLYQGWQDCINNGYMKKGIPVGDITDPMKWETANDWVSVGYVVEPEDGAAGCDTVFRDGVSLFGLSGDKSGFLSSLGYVSVTTQADATTRTAGGTSWKFQGCVIPPQGSSGPTRSGTENSDLASCFRKTIISKFGEPAMTTEMFVLRNKTTLDEIGVHFRKTTNITSQDAWIEFSNTYPYQYGSYGNPILKIAVVDPATPSVTLVPYYAGADFSLEGTKFELGSIDNGQTHERATAKQILDALNTFYSRQNDEINAAIANGTFDADAYTEANRTEAQGQVEEERSCAIDGIGWIVCGVMKAVAGMNDLMYEGVENILLINPLAMTEGGVESPAYSTWKQLRDLGNALLVVAFLVIIFSQLTNLGVSNYGIKKTLPRIIIVAIAINLSYFVMMVAIDAVNIIGVGLHDLISNAAGGALDIAQASGGWENVIQTVLAGGAIAGSIGIAVAVSSATAVGMMVLPFVLGAVLAIFAAFVTLALRNALVIVLAIVAPLAFAAFLLPNTKNLFDKWRKMLTSMLFMFPMAALLFAGAKLAGAIIISLNGTLNHVFGLFIAAAPLFMLPWLARSSGGMLAKVGGQLGKMGKQLQGSAQKGLAPMVQQRKDERRAELAAGERNMFGRSRANQVRTPEYRRLQAEYDKGRRQGESAGDWRRRSSSLLDQMRGLDESGRSYQPARNTVAQRLALGRVARDANIARLKKQPSEQLKEMAEMAERGVNPETGQSLMREAGYSRGATKLGERAASVIDRERVADIRAQAVDSRSKTAFEARHREGVILEGKAAEARLKAEQDQTGQLVQELSTEAGAALRPDLAEASQVLRIAHRDSQVAQMATDSAKRVSTDEFAQEIIASQPLAAQAGGIDPRGEARAVSKAQSAVSAAREETIGNVMNEHKLHPERSAVWHLARLGDETARAKLPPAERYRLGATDADTLAALTPAERASITPFPPSRDISEEEAAASIRRIKDVGGAGDVAALARLTPRLASDQARDEAKGTIAAKLGDKMPVFMSQMGNMGNPEGDPARQPFNEEEMWKGYVTGTSFSLEDFISQPLQRDELIKYASTSESLSPQARDVLLERLQYMREQIEQSQLAKEKIAPKAIENLDAAIVRLQTPPTPPAP